jgi:hypothetical protein
MEPELHPDLLRMELADRAVLEAVRSAHLANQEFTSLAPSFPRRLRLGERQSVVAVSEAVRQGTLGVERPVFTPSATQQASRAMALVS